MAKQNEDRPKLGALMKTLPKQETPLQQVQPVKQKSTEEQAKIHGFMADESFVMQVKTYALKSKKSLTTLMIAALEEYMENHPLA